MITKIIAATGAIFTGWVTILATVMLLSDDAPAALVMFPDTAFLNALPKDVAVTSKNAISVTVTGDAAALYRAGAWLVLPAGLLGCAPLTL